jgi:hypothetical protein
MGHKRRKTARMKNQFKATSSGVPSTEEIEYVLGKLSPTRRTRLADLKANPHTLRYMAKNGYIALFNIDNGREMTQADRDAEVNYGGSPTHLAYRID